MGKFEITAARQELGFTPSTSVRGNVQVPLINEGSAIGAAVIAGAEIYKQYELKVANTEFSEYKRNVALDDVDLNKEVGDQLDPTLHEEIYKRHAEKRKQLMPKSEIGAKAAGLWNNTREAGYKAKLFADMDARANDNWEAEVAQKIGGIKQDGSAEKLADLTKFIEIRQKVDPLPQTKVNNLLAIASEAQAIGNITLLYRTGDYAGARKATEASSLDITKKESMINTIDASETRSLKHIESVVEAELEVIDNIFTLPIDKFLASVSVTLDKINDSTVLPVKGENGAGKEGQRKKINDRVKAIHNGDIDPINKFDPTAYNNIVTKITKNSMGVKSTDITTPVGMGTNGGWTAAQAKDLTALKKFYDGADILGTDLHRIYSGAVVGLRTSKAFSANPTENAFLAARTLASLNAWAVKNQQAGETEYQDFFNRLMDTSKLTNWQKFWVGRDPAEQRLAIRQNLATFEKELGIEANPITKKYKKGDTETIEGIKWTFDGKVWHN